MAFSVNKKNRDRSRGFDHGYREVRQTSRNYNLSEQHQVAPTPLPEALISLRGKTHSDRTAFITPEHSQPPKRY